jgi:hypothetical protein
LGYRDSKMWTEFMKVPPLQVVTLNLILVDFGVDIDTMASGGDDDMDFFEMLGMSNGNRMAGLTPISQLPLLAMSLMMSCSHTHSLVFFFVRHTRATPTNSVPQHSCVRSCSPDSSTGSFSWQPHGFNAACVCV